MSSVRIGDGVFYRTPKGRWKDGWTVIGIDNGTDGFPARATISKPHKADLSLSLHAKDAFFIPPEGEYHKFRDVLKKYPNLLVVRNLAGNDDFLLLLCRHCMQQPMVTQHEETNFHLLLRSNGLIENDTPEQGDGFEVQHCGCKRRKYHIDYQFEA